jgi:hypothetical protein
MSNIESYKKSIKESIYNGFTMQGMKEKLDPHVDELAGSIIAAGPQKVGDAISKMDPATFAEFCKKIDAQGILMVTKQFSASAAPTAPTNADPNAQATSEVPSPDLNQELSDL